MRLCGMIHWGAMLAYGAAGDARKLPSRDLDNVMPGLVKFQYDAHRPRGATMKVWTSLAFILLFEALVVLGACYLWGWI